MTGRLIAEQANGGRLPNRYSQGQQTVVERIEIAPVFVSMKHIGAGGQCQRREQNFAGEQLHGCYLRFSPSPEASLDTLENECDQRVQPFSNTLNHNQPHGNADERVGDRHSTSRFRVGYRMAVANERQDHRGVVERANELPLLLPVVQAHFYRTREIMKLAVG